ncbi:MAG: hypothetical protein WAV00_05630 [Nocardioides sp.]
MGIVRSVDGKDFPRARCRYCHREILEDPELGWFDPEPGDSYDMCPGNPNADHEPDDARGDIARFIPPGL